jgi:hypothetical protein
MIINAQVIIWNSFNEKILNDVTFNRLNEYTKIKGGYSVSNSSEEHGKIYKCLIGNDGELLLDELSSEINGIISVSSVVILDRVSIRDIKTYQEIADKCITDWANSQSDAFFMIGWGKSVDVTSHYNNRIGMIYISLVIRSNY